MGRLAQTLGITIHSAPFENLGRLMPAFTSPEVVVQRQLDAYNAKSLSAWLSTYAEDAKQFELGGALLAQGHEAIRARTAPRSS